jgi:glycosyltransferase involved in cell wall biosynthesis
VGIQNKVLEAMSMCTPVVASHTACRALTAKDGEDLLVARSSANFATQVIRLLDDKALGERIGANGRRYVEQNHEWSTIAQALSAIYEEVVANNPRRERRISRLTKLAPQALQGID